jgi:hypothetical protein
MARLTGTACLGRDEVRRHRPWPSSLGRHGHALTAELAVDLVGELRPPHAGRQAVSDQRAETKRRTVCGRESIRPLGTHGLRHGRKADEVDCVCGPDIGASKLPDDLSQLIQGHPGVRGANHGYGKLHQDADFGTHPGGRRLPQGHRRRGEAGHGHQRD